MGVNLKGLFDFEEIEITDLNGKKIAVDAYNTIYQFLSIIRQHDGTPLKDSKGNMTSHLSGLFYRSVNLMNAGLSLCFVFDGKPPVLKSSTLKIRKERKILARQQYEEALRKGDLERARSKASQTARMDDKIVKESKELLQALGIPVVQAPSEGEAQSSYLVSTRKCYATASQDYDALLFGSNVLVRNLNVSGKRKLPGKNVYTPVKPEQIRLSQVLNYLGIDKDQLILIGMLCGTDFNNGVKGIGAKTALKKVKACKTLDALRKELNWDEENIDEVFNLFKNPEVNKVKTLKWEDIDAEKVRRILVDEHDFSESRVNSALKKLSEAKDERSQTLLLTY